MPVADTLHLTHAQTHTHAEPHALRNGWDSLGLQCQLPCALTNRDTHISRLCPQRHPGAMVPLAAVLNC